MTTFLKIYPTEIILKPFDLNTIFNYFCLTNSRKLYQKNSRQVAKLKKIFPQKFYYKLLNFFIIFNLFCLIDGRKLHKKIAIQMATFIKKNVFTNYLKSL